jgi:cyclopropane-fatty-acyl-phospholipid synthase
MAVSATTTYTPKFYERILFSAFNNMPNGKLNITMPNGTSFTFGKQASPIANIEIKNTVFFKRCVLYGDIGFGESYVNGDWDTNNITDVIKWFIHNIEYAPSVSGSRLNSYSFNFLKGINKLNHLLRKNTLSGSQKNISEHYDLNNAFFALFLDSSMTYSSAYFKDAKMSLQEAQYAKYDRLCKKLKLNASDHVLEIGSGWGSNAIYMAKHYGCRVTSITISEEQFKYAKQKAIDEHLSDKITFELKDYRDIEGTYDKIVSIEMLEAVGANYYETFFSVCHQLLKKNGLLALQVITCPDSRFKELKNGVDWIQKHIFPGSLLPSVGALNQAINQVSDLSLVNLKEMGLDYAHTLHIWYDEFNKKLAEVKQLGFDDSFIRQWNYYLCYCEAAFAMRNINVMQILYSRPNNLNL